MSDFPPLATIKEDAKHYSVTRKDNTIRTDVEGGYTISRPRTTRALRRIWTTGFTGIDNTERNLIETFYAEQSRGGAMTFSWTDPIEQEEHVVRFIGDLSWQYEGMGSRPLWTLKVTLEEA